MRTLPGGVLGAPTPDVRDHYSLGRVLGKGAFATTRLAKSKRGDGGAPPTVAVKSVAKARLASTIEVDAAKREVEILKQLKECQSVVTLYDAFEDQQHSEWRRGGLGGGRGVGRPLRRRQGVELLSRGWLMAGAGAGGG